MPEHYPDQHSPATLHEALQYQTPGQGVPAPYRRKTPFAYSVDDDTLRMKIVDIDIPLERLITLTVKLTIATLLGAFLIAIVGGLIFMLFVALFK